MQCMYCTKGDNCNGSGHIYPELLEISYVKTYLTFAFMTVFMTALFEVYLTREAVSGK